VDHWDRIVAEGAPELVHGHAEGELGLVRSGLVGRGTRTPVLATLYGSAAAGVVDHLRLAGAGSESGALRAARRLKSAATVVPTFGRAVDYSGLNVVALSRRHSRLVKASYAARNVDVVYPGVDCLTFHPAAPEVKVDLRRRLRLPDAAFVWAAAGRLSPGKGLGVAVDAFALRRRTGEVLLIVGDGHSRPALEARARELGIADTVHFAGALPRPAAAFMAADAFLFPTRHEESFGLVVAEAMACGLPVIASHLGATPEVVGDTGMLLGSLDPRIWCFAMSSVGASAERRDAMGRAARTRAMGAFSRGATVTALERLYARVRSAGA
jgi:glycosyltransferase involved in cell wall biosynthesis